MTKTIPTSTCVWVVDRLAQHEQLERKQNAHNGRHVAQQQQQCRAETGQNVHQINIP